MAKFYDPSQPEQYLSSPKLFGVLPIKLIVISMQILYMLLQIVWLTASDVTSKVSILLVIASVILTAFTVAVFVVENKSLMQAHIWAASLFVFVPLAAFVLIIAQFFFDIKFLATFFGEGIYTHPITSLTVAAVFLCAYIAYLFLCHKLVEAKDQQPDDFPELDTTQGLFHYNRDAYDGSERVNLIYPEV
ncbi:unnamed protein product [Caenorhabditis nigoni]